MLIKIAILKMKTFNEKVYELLKKVPKGKVTTYKAIANALETNAYRVVGRVLNKNTNAPKIPCHRVINSNGKLGGYSKGIGEKIRLLKKEGVEEFYRENPHLRP